MRTAALPSCKTLVSAGTASLAAGPIMPRLRIEVIRSVESGSSTARMSSGTALPAAGPIWPTAAATAVRSWTSPSFRCWISGGKAAAPMETRALNRLFLEAKSASRKVSVRAGMAAEPNLASAYVARALSGGSEAFRSLAIAGSASCAGWSMTSKAPSALFLTCGRALSRALTRARTEAGPIFTKVWTASDLTAGSLSSRSLASS